MSRRRVASFAATVLAVLACAAVAVVLRGALQSDSAPGPLAGPRVNGATSTPSQTFDPAAAQSRKVPAGAALIASAKHSTIRVYSHADARRSKALHQRVFNGQRIRLVFLVRSKKTGWVRVQLPTRPNLSSAWVRRGDVRLSYTSMRVVISLKHHRLEVFDGTKLSVRTPIGVGQSVSPTPRGRYFITDVVRPKNPKGFYGPYALGLSAHSNVYSSFEGGNGQVGIHGTNLPQAIGSNVSHGCVRVRNAVITRLARSLPLGTPVTIAA